MADANQLLSDEMLRQVEAAAREAVAAGIATSGRQLSNVAAK